MLARMRNLSLLVVVLATVCWKPSVGRDEGLPIVNFDELQPLNILDPVTVKFLNGIPNLFGLCTAIKAIPHGIVVQIREFLERIVEDIPENNLLKFHFNNVIFLIKAYESIIDKKIELIQNFKRSLRSKDKKPVMFRDVSEAITNPFEEFIKPFKFGDTEIPFISSLLKAPLDNNKPIKLTQL